MQDFDYLGAPPESLCALAPWTSANQCSRPVDSLINAGMFITLGALFAGIAVGVNTFGRERVVYWRDTASGMATIPYYLAKVIIDIPRVFFGALLYSLALVLFFPYRQNFIGIFYLCLAIYFSAFAIGYFISIVFRRESTPLIGVGMALLFSIGLGGVVPKLEAVFGTDYPMLSVETTPLPGYPVFVRWLWAISAPRWAIEAFWIKETEFRPFREKAGTLPNLYVRSNCNLKLT